jgi:hypothetical protein
VLLHVLVLLWHLLLQMLILLRLQLLDQLPA